MNETNVMHTGTFRSHKLTVYWLVLTFDRIEIHKMFMLLISSGLYKFKHMSLSLKLDSEILKGLGLGLESLWVKSCSWSRDLRGKVSVLISRPTVKSLGLALESFSKVSLTTLGYSPLTLS